MAVKVKRGGELTILPRNAQDQKKAEEEHAQRSRVELTTMNWRLRGRGMGAGVEIRVGEVMAG
jgi:hypothetical protein